MTVVETEGTQDIYGKKRFIENVPECDTDPRDDEDLVRLKYYNDHLPAAGGNCSIETGTYTGNGALDKKITTSITPKYVKVWYYTAVDGQNDVIFEKVDTMGDNWSIMHCVTATKEHQIKDNGLITLDVDGFHVDDDGINNHPNANGFTYCYLVLGI
jgi:hypothetical protein